MAELRSIGGRRIAAKEQAWRERFAEQTHSGLRVAEFCRRQGIEPSAFYYWKKEIARRDSERNTAPQFNGRQAMKPVAGFAEIGVKHAEQGCQNDLRSTAPITIHFATGCHMEVPVGFDARTLQEIIRVLRGESC